jgi:hypothetical protein
VTTEDWKGINIKGGKLIINNPTFNIVDKPSSSKDLPSVDTKLTSVPPAKPIEVLYCCSDSEKDEEMRQNLEKHLKILQRQGVITTWHKGMMGAGKEWESETNKQLMTADIILLLISVDFIASDWCWDVEVKPAMERHEAKQARVIPVILRRTDDWENNTPFRKLKPLPKDGKPVSEWGNRDKAFCNIAEGIRAAVDELTASV